MYGQEFKPQVKDSIEITDPIDVEKYPQNVAVITGVVVDSDGNPLPGVNLVSSGTMIGAITDHEGRFEIAVPPGSKVTISNIGYSTYTFTAQESTEIRIDFENGIIVFCCTNHKPNHCAATIEEMRRLTRRYECSFK